MRPRHSCADCFSAKRFGNSVSAQRPSQVASNPSLNTDFPGGRARRRERPASFISSYAAIASVTLDRRLEWTYRMLQLPK